MSGTLYAVVEIIVFMVGATILGFLIGRLGRRSRPSLGDAEVGALRERTGALESELDDLTTALAEARGSAGDRGELEGRVAMAEREAEGLERRLGEAIEKVHVVEGERDTLAAAVAQAEAAASAAAVEVSGGGDVSESVAAEIETMRAELDRRGAELERLRRTSGDAAAVEEQLAARDERIRRLEEALERHEAAQIAGGADTAAIGISMGGGNFADSRLEFEAWDPREDD